MIKKGTPKPKRIEDFIPDSHKTATNSMPRRFEDNFFCERQHARNRRGEYCGREAIITAKYPNGGYLSRGYFCLEHLGDIGAFLQEHPETRLHIKFGHSYTDPVGDITEYLTIWTAEAVKERG